MVACEVEPLWAALCLCSPSLHTHKPTSKPLKTACARCYLARYLCYLWAILERTKPHKTARASCYLACYLRYLWAILERMKPHKTACVCRYLVRYLRYLRR